jgi:hypothetical protein
MIYEQAAAEAQTTEGSEDDAAGGDDVVEAEIVDEGDES